MTLALLGGAPLSLYSTLAEWPWSTMISTAGAIAVAVIARGNQKRVDETVKVVSDKANEFNRAIDRLDEHFKTQSELLGKAIDGLGKD